MRELPNPPWADVATCPKLSHSERRCVSSNGMYIPWEEDDDEEKSAG